jgi:hypothetical protein
MHVPPAPGAVGNSGFFVWADPIPAVGTGYTRGIEVQVLVNLTYTDKKTGAVTASSHGDLFSIWGATCVPDRPHPQGWARCIPSENRAKGANEWNHYRVEANDGVIKLAVNGKVVSGVSKCSPRKGYLALESEGSECRFRNLKIKELPSTNPKPGEIADEDKGFRNLFTGLDLTGWSAAEGVKKHWQPHDGVLRYDGKAEAKDTGVRTDKEYGNSEFISDFRFPVKKRDKPETCQFILRKQAEAEVKLILSSAGRYNLLTASAGGGIDATGEIDLLLGKWNRLQAIIKGKQVSVKINGKELPELVSAVPEKGAFALGADGEMEFRSLFVRELAK